LLEHRGEDIPRHVGDNFEAYAVALLPAWPTQDGASYALPCHLPDGPIWLPASRRSFPAGRGQSRSRKWLIENGLLAMNRTDFQAGQRFFPVFSLSGREQRAVRAGEG